MLSQAGMTIARVTLNCGRLGLSTCTATWDIESSENLKLRSTVTDAALSTTPIVLSTSSPT